jgi:hypothetical protein
VGYDATTAHYSDDMAAPTLVLAERAGGKVKGLMHLYNPVLDP